MNKIIEVCENHCEFTTDSINSRDSIVRPYNGNYENREMKYRTHVTNLIVLAQHRVKDNACHTPKQWSHSSDSERCHPISSMRTLGDFNECSYGRLRKVGYTAEDPC